MEAIESTPPADLVEVRTPKFAYVSDATDPRAYNPTAVTWRVRDGFTVTFRPRTPEDGDAAVIVEADPPIAVEQKPDDGESYGQWRQRVVDQGSNGQQAHDAIKVGPGAGRYEPERQPTWTERQGGFAGWGGR